MDKSMLTQRAHNLRKNSTAAKKHQILRFWNYGVFQQTSSILEVIMKAPHP
jgi:very-short-patch-repair endonuclease